MRMQIPMAEHDALRDLFIEVRGFMRDRPRRKGWEWDRIRKALAKVEEQYPPAREEPQIPGSGHHPDCP